MLLLLTLEIIQNKIEYNYISITRNKIILNIYFKILKNLSEIVKRDVIFSLKWNDAQQQFCTAVWK